ncbi:MAG: Do family serine endopeptidase [Bacteroidota bacterium]
MTKKHVGLLLGAAFVLAMISSVAGVGVYKAFFDADRVVYLPQESVPATFTKSVDQPSSTATLPDFVGASDQARPAVVHIRSRFEARRGKKNSDFFSNPFRDFFEDDMFEMPEGMASGSGVLISPDGYIATNNHVIEDAKSVEVTLFDNRTFPATVVGTDITTDLALLKIEEDDLPHLTFGNSDDVKVGQWVLAVGNPMDLNSTVTAGIVSAKGRNINLLRGDSEFAIESFIQTDAAVNKGNSGGALVDTQGRLIGINTAIASRTGYYAGYSFAIPASIARKVMEDLLSFGEVRRGFLGVTIQPVNAELAKREQLSVTKGAYISGVNPGLGAAEAGMQKGDVIISVNDVEVNSSSELQEQVSRYRPGEKVTVSAWRGDEERTFIVTLKVIERSQITTNRQPETERNEDGKGSVQFKGSTFRLLTDTEKEELEVESGVIIDEVGETLSEGGIQSGFVLTEIDGKKIRNIEDLEDALIESDEYVTMKGMYSKGMIASYSFNW